MHRAAPAPDPSPGVVLVTLEGLPHAVRSCVLRHLVRQCPDWDAVNVLPDPVASCAWASAACRSSHALFAALLRKVTALGRPRERGAGVLLLNSPWFEHAPRCRPVWDLLLDMTHELVRRCGSSVRVHVMAMLLVPPDETFEQIVCCGNPSWNATSLADVAAAQRGVAAQVQRARDEPGSHPFPCVTHTVQCPPFPEENEVVTAAIASAIAATVAAAIAGTAVATDLNPAASR